VIQRSRLGSIDLKVEQLFESKSEEEIQKAREQNLEKKSKELENKYSNSLTEICATITMNESTYGYALGLFKSVMVRIDSAISCSEPHRLSPNQRELVAKVNSNPTLFRDTEKLFKVCIYEGYKVIEDEYALYLEDFAKVSKINKEELEDLEIFVVSDVMQFRMVSLFAFDEQVSEEV